MNRQLMHCGEIPGIDRMYLINIRVNMESLTHRLY